MRNQASLPGQIVPEDVAWVARRMTSFPRQWSLCGGYAVDYWVGRQTRSHADVDFAIFREDERAIFDTLADWNLVAHDHPDDTHSEVWNGRPMDFPAHIHAGWGADGPDGDIQMSEHEGDDWILSRDPRVTLPISRFGLQSSWGIHVMAAEAVLFYKSGPDRRPHDDLDFDVLAPRLDDYERAWLASVIVLSDTSHPWLRRLS